MERLPVEKYIKLGRGLRYLLHVKAGYPINQPTTVNDTCVAVLKIIDTAGFPVTSKSKPYVEIKEIVDSFEGTTEDDKLETDVAQRLALAGQGLEMIVDAEAGNVMAYQFEELRTKPDRLLEPGSLLAAGVWEALPFQCRYDFGEACRCLILERSTACAFHLMRAVESVVGVYYCGIYRRGRIEVRTWGGMTHHLKQRKAAPLPDRSVLEELDYVRRNYRNPTQHPEVNYDLATAEDLLNRAIGAINKTMIDAIARRLLDQCIDDDA